MMDIKVTVHPDELPFPVDLVFRGENTEETRIVLKAIKEGKYKILVRRMGWEEVT